MTPRTADEIAGLVGGTLRGDGSARGQRAVTDSRTARVAGDVFFGLVGERRDGGQFAAQALAEGASIAVVRAGTPVAALPARAAVIEVADPLDALQRLARDERARWRGDLVAITGSAGKTTVKDMLVAALSSTRRVYASPMSYNSQIGVALSLLGLGPSFDVAVIECGISEPGEMARLEAMVRPTAGIFVGVADAHLAGFGTRGRIAGEKALLFRDVRADSWVLAPAADSLAAAALAAIGAPVVGVPDGPAPIDLPATELRVDARLACAAALALGASPADLAAGLAGWRPAPMRLEVSETPRGITLINDAYVADTASAEAALSALVRGPRGGRSFAVLGGLEQQGASREAAHAHIGRRAAELGVDVVIGVGAGGNEIAAAARAAGLAKSAVVTVPSVEDAAAVLEERATRGDRVLLKASRPERLERIATLLFESVAPTRMFVDLDQLAENARSIRRFVPPGVGVIAVVKSFGYGLDATRTAAALAATGVDQFCVAYADEGLRLRESGITQPILVQNVVPEDAMKCALHALTAELVSVEQLEALDTAAQRAQRAIRAHIKVDSGMGRAGALPDQAVEIARRAASTTWVRVEGVMTHFASADDPRRDDDTRAQLATFRATVDRIEALGLSPRWVHAANSHGLARFPQSHFTAVRPGLALLGYAQVDGVPICGTRPVMRLTTRVVATKELPPGAAVGYGATWRSARPTRTALVAIGYGDGYPRALSSRGWMSVHGDRCPVIGRVSMDVTTIDITDVSQAVGPGDEVIVFGDGPAEPDLCALADAADTIPYELLARITGRVRRIFRSSHS